MRTRTARFEILCRGKNVSAALAPYLESVTWEDNAQSSQSDSIELRLEDRDGLFRGPWKLSKGDKLEATLIVEDWQREGDSVRLRCGTFEVDELEYEYGEGGDKLSLKGISSMVTSTLRREKKTRAWEATTLSHVLSEIAAEQGFSPRFGGDDVPLARLDQREESDAALLTRLAKAHGKAFKVYSNQLVMMDEKAQDAKPAAGTISRDGGELKRLSLRDSLADIYSACKVTYHDAAANVTQEYTYTPPDAPESGQTLKISDRVESRAAAEERAKTELRRKNKLETSGNIEIMGNPRFIGGSVCGVSGFGWLDGTYFIEQSRHTVDDSGYSTALSVRRTMDW